MYIEPQAFYGLLGSLLTAFVGAIAYGMRERSKTRSYTEKKRADGDLVTEESQAKSLVTLTEIASRSVDVQREMVAVTRDSTRAAGENAAELRGMIAMLNEHSKIVRNATISMDEVAVQIPGMKTELHAIHETTSSLQTNIQTDIEGTMNEQFGPIVVAMTNVGVQVAALVVAVQTKDGEINSRLTQLITDFQAAETRLMKVLEPIVLKHTIGELPHETPVTHETE
jgi:hypothetical protein